MKSHFVLLEINRQLLHENSKRRDVPEVLVYRCVTLPLPPPPHTTPAPKRTAPQRPAPTCRSADKSQRQNGQRRDGGAEMSCSETPWASGGLSPQLGPKPRSEFAGTNLSHLLYFFRKDKWHSEQII